MSEEMRAFRERGFVCLRRVAENDSVFRNQCSVSLLGRFFRLTDQLLTEDRATNTHQICAAFDSDFEVIAHTHREDVEARTANIERADFIKQFFAAREHAACIGCARVCVRACARVRGGRVRAWSRLRSSAPCT